MADSTFLDNIVAAWGGSEVEGDRESDPFPDETRSPYINSLIRKCRRYMQGFVESEDLILEVESAVIRLRRAVDEHQGLYEHFELPDEARRVADVAELAYMGFSQGLRMITDAFKIDNLPDMELAVERCRAATQVLEACGHRFAEMQHAFSQSSCPSCGHANDVGARQCSGCAATLPRVPSEPGHHDMVMVPESYMHLFTACDQVAAGSLEVSQWQAELDNFLEGFAETRMFVDEQFANFAEGFDAEPSLRQTGESLLVSLEQAEAALVEMQLFAEDGDVEHLNEGWYRLLQATQLVQQDGLNFYRVLERLDQELNDGEAEEELAEAEDQISFQEED